MSVKMVNIQCNGQNISISTLIEKTCLLLVQKWVVTLSMLAVEKQYLNILPLKSFDGSDHPELETEFASLKSGAGQILCQ